MKKEMLINVLQPEECRIAILENGVLEELYVERTSHESYVGNIYKGRIVNIEPSIQAAFVDFGVGRNGFLHVSDVEPAYYRHLEQHREDRDPRRGGRGGRGERISRPGVVIPPAPKPASQPVTEGQVIEEETRVTEFAPDLMSTEMAPTSYLPPAFPPELGVPTDIPIVTDLLGEGADWLDSEEGEDEDSGQEPVDTQSPEMETGEFLEEVDEDELQEPKGTVSFEAAILTTEEEEDSPEEEEAQEEVAEKPKRRGRGRGRRGRGTSKKMRGAAGPKASEEAPSLEPNEIESDEFVKDLGEDDKPRPMESAERRTKEEDGEGDEYAGEDPDEDSPGEESSAVVASDMEEMTSREGSYSDFSDEDLSFSLRQPTTAPISAPRYEKPSEPMPEESPRESPAFTESTSEPETAQVISENANIQRHLAEAFEEDYPQPMPRRNGGRERDRGDRGDRGDRRGGGGRERDRGDRGDRGDRRGGGRERDRGDRRGGGGRPGMGRPGMGRPGMGRPKPLIQDIFKKGQEVLVQVIKEGIGTKGPTLSTYISIAGRYLVLMPGLNRIGVSRKIQDDEQRRRLREILSELKPPRGLGFIIRTAGLDRTKKELQRDLAYLSRLWQVVVRRIRKMKAPAEIYQESDMITRTIRDTFTSEIQAIYVDEPKAFEHAQEFLQFVMPRYANRIKCFTESEPIFHKYGIENEISRIHQKTVPLPHGGSIVIEQTEALVAIDVNSGNFRADNNAEETAYQMNMLAAREIARQLRLRDLGGVIVNDFIDMREEKHRRGVERALREAIKRDRARTKVLKISAFGIIEMTRQRIRPSLKRSVFQECPCCTGSGHVKTWESMSIEVMRMLQLAAHREHVTQIQVKVHPEVSLYLLNRKRKVIGELEEKTNVQVFISGAPVPSPEYLEFHCFDNTGTEILFAPPEPPARPRRRY